MKAGLAVALLLGVAACPAAAHVVPGVVSQAGLGERDFARMERGGVETLRFLLRRSLAEPSPGVYDWTRVDPVVAAAARHRIRLLPMVYGSPPWLDRVEEHPPLDDRAARAGWRSFLTALVDRYGSRGQFWIDRPDRLPIRRWQIWNEPNFDLYWDPEPSADEYARLVELSAATIREADPRARIVLAGIAPVHAGVPLDEFLADFYRRPQIKRAFDFAALHPYSPGVHFLTKQVRRARRVMADARDARTPLAITELGWASAGRPGAPLVVGERRQARLLRQSFRYLGRHPKWRISDVQWYAWQDTPAIEAACTFCANAGLFDLDGTAKPAWHAFQRVAR